MIPPATDPSAGHAETAVLETAIDYEKACRETGLGRAKIEVLLDLARHGISRQDAISSRTRCVPATLRRHLADLRISGHVLRETDENNARRARFDLSGHGRRLVCRLTRILA